MGLLLSVLVACVGVVELLAFYSNVTRNFVTVSTQTNFSNISNKYLEGLEQHRKNLQTLIFSETCNGDEEKITRQTADPECDEIGGKETKPAKKDTKSIEIEVETPSQVKAPRADPEVSEIKGQPSPVNGLETENELIEIKDIVSPKKILEAETRLLEVKEGTQSLVNGLETKTKVLETEQGPPSLVEVPEIRASSPIKLLEIKSELPKVTEAPSPVEVPDTKLVEIKEVLQSVVEVPKTETNLSEVRPTSPIKLLEIKTELLEVKKEDARNIEAKALEIKQEQNKVSEIKASSPIESLERKSELLEVKVAPRSVEVPNTECKVPEIKPGEVQKIQDTQSSKTVPETGNERPPETNGHPSLPTSTKEPNNQNGTVDLVGLDPEPITLTNLEPFAAPRSRSPSPIPKRLGEPEVFRRSPSPYPSLVLSVPRNSICNDFLDNAALRLAEVDEESFSRSPTPEKLQLILESKHSTTEYWSNKILVVPPAKPRSHTPLELQEPVSSVSILEVKTQLQNDFTLVPSKEDLENEKKYDELLDSLDGVKKKKLSRSNSSRRSRKKKTTLSIDNESKDDSLSSTSMQNNETAKTLTEAANVLKSVNQEAGGHSESSAGTSKDNNAGEPFWLIFSGEYTKAMNKDWHGQHFCCWQCDESLTGQRYVLRDDHPYCVSCYESVFANACEKCSRTIGIDSKDLSYKDKHWHEACFLCTTCGESLVDRQFGSKGDRIYCGRCYDEQFASRCDGCHEIFRAGTKKMEYKTRQWHEKCFCCCVCKVPIGTQSFIPREQEIYCAKCYEEKFATRCIKCNKVITSGGVTYKNEPWHRECFTCTNCSKSLAGERFTSRDEKPYCAECFGELFAKRCFACNKPITGIGGTKFISFEDRHWHNDCFFCASCRTSLVGRGFITDQDDIICPECAKQKLM